MTIVCMDLAGCSWLAPLPPAPPGGPTLPLPDGPAPPLAGVTKWHTEHLTQLADTGYISLGKHIKFILCKSGGQEGNRQGRPTYMMLQPPHTRC